MPLKIKKKINCVSWTQLCYGYKILILKEKKEDPLAPPLILVRAVWYPILFIDSRAA